MENLNESNIEEQSSFDSHTEEININQDFNNLSQDNIDHKETLQRLIEETMSYRIAVVETKSENQEKEILDLMYTYHWYTFQIDSLRDQLPKPPLRRPYTTKSTFKYKNDESNTSIHSIKSKRSTSTLRKEYARQVGRNYGAQKVSINIGNGDDETAAVTTRKTTKSSANDIHALEKNLKPKGRDSSKAKNIKVISKKETPVRVTTLSPKESLDIAGGSKLNSNYFSLKSNLTNTTTESLHTTKNNFKFEPKRKHPVGSDGMAQLYIDKMNMDKVNSGSVSKNFSSKNCYKIPVKNLFVNENNSNIFIKILECCNTTKEKLKLKDISKHMRKKYFQYEIHNLETLKQYKQAQRNPFFNIKMTNNDEIFNKTFIFSENLRKYDKNQHFINLVKLLYIILIDNNHTKSTKTVNEMIEEIESFKTHDKNIYSKYSEIIHSLKTNSGVYQTIKHNTEYLHFESITGIINLNILFELVTDMRVILENETPKVDLILDIEILTHKIETLKTLNSQI
jgi:hypothetical protein